MEPSRLTSPLPLAGRRKRPRILVHLKCPKCRVRGTAEWNSGNRRDDLHVSASFTLFAQPSGPPLFLCKVCGVTADET